MNECAKMLYFKQLISYKNAKCWLVLAHCLNVWLSAR